MEASNYGAGARRPVRRLATETKQAFKSTEFWAYVVVLIGIFIAGAVADGGDLSGGFGPERVWLYATLLTIGYMISRGLAKAGSRDPYWDQPSSESDSGLGDRVKAAAQALRDGESQAGTTSQTGAGETARY